jgi:hypothetical protein
VFPETILKDRNGPSKRSRARRHIGPSWHIVSLMGQLRFITTRAVDDVIDAVVKWSEDFIEQPHEIFGGLPVCPFARAARIKQTIRFEVRPFAFDDPLEPNGDILTLVREFVEEASGGRLDTLFVIHPDPGQALSDLLAFVARLNSNMADGELHAFQAFEAHPESQFRVGNLYTRRSPYPSFQVLSRALLKKGSDSLLDSPYYSRFSPEMLRAVGMPRE